MNIHIPKGCSCDPHHQIGEHNNTVEVSTPPHMLALGSIGCYIFRPTLCIDRCLLPLIEALWGRGVVTTGSCCGHNQRDGYIGIHQ